MTTYSPPATAFEPAPDFADPRLGKDFDPKHWPLCNGEAAAGPGSRETHDRRCVEFLAAFYRINVVNHRLLDARAAGAGEEAVKLLLNEITIAIFALESLEDRYAPIGFFGEPVMDGIRYQNILFVRAELPRIYQKPSLLSAAFSIPGLEDLPESELQGQAEILSLGHGKVDF